MTLARIRALILVGLLFVAATVVSLIAVNKDSQTLANASEDCPAGSIPVSLAVPEYKDIKIRLINGGDNRGQANSVGNDLKFRKLNVVEIKNSPGGKQYDEVAIIRFGPKTVGAAWVMRAFFLNEAQTEYNAKRTDDVLEVVLGKQFAQLATQTEVNQSIGALRAPTLPDGTCDATPKK